MDPVMNSLTQFSWSPVVQVLVLTLGVFISFMVSYGNGYVSIYLPFISETGAHVPAMGIFSLTLYFGSVAGVVVVCFRNLIMRQLLSSEQHRMRKLNDISSMIGIASMAGLAGVGAFPVTSVFFVHMIFASAHFFFAEVYMVLQTIVDHYVPDVSVFWHRIRIVLCLGVMLQLFLLVIFFPIAFIKWFKVNKQPPAVKTPKDEVFELMFISSSLEWLMYGTFLTFLCSFIHEFRKFILVIGVTPVSPKTDQDELQQQQQE